MLKLETRISRFLQIPHATKFKATKVQENFDPSQSFELRHRHIMLVCFSILVICLDFYEYHWAIKISIEKDIDSLRYLSSFWVRGSLFGKQRWQIWPRLPVILKMGKVWPKTESLPSKFSHFKIRWNQVCFVSTRNMNTDCLEK